MPRRRASRSESASISPCPSARPPFMSRTPLADISQTSSRFSHPPSSTTVLIFRRHIPSPPLRLPAREMEARGGAGKIPSHRLLTPTVSRNDSIAISMLSRRALRAARGDGRLGAEQFFPSAVTVPSRVIAVPGRGLGPRPKSAPEPGLRELNPAPLGCGAGEAGRPKQCGQGRCPLSLQALKTQ